MHFMVLSLCLIYASVVFPSEIESHSYEGQGQHGIYVPPSNANNAAFTYTDSYCGYRYKMYTRLRVNWMEAHIHCLKEGMGLTTVESEEEFNFLKNFTLSSGVTKSENFWTSGNDLLREGKFTWLTTGEDVTFFPVGSKHPPDNYKGHENCISLYRIPSHVVMNDFNCTTRMLFICKTKI